MNLFQSIVQTMQAWKSGNPPAQTPDIIPLRTFLTHPDAGIVSVDSVTPAPSNNLQMMGSLTFLTPGHEHPRPTRTFDRCDTSLIIYDPKDLKPDREVQHF